MRVGLFALSSVLLPLGSLQAQETTAYGYDAQGRLTSASHSGAVNNALQQTYVYDKADNRTSVVVTGSPFTTSNRVVAVPLMGISLIPLGK